MNIKTVLAYKHKKVKVEAFVSIGFKLKTKRQGVITVRQALLSSQAFAPGTHTSVCVISISCFTVGCR